MAINKLPIVVPPEEDEFIYSYFCRLAKINGFTELKSFINHYVIEDYYKNNKHNMEKTMKYNHNRYCKSVYFTKFYNSIEPDINIVDLYLSLSLYNCTSIVMRPDQQLEQIIHTFDPKERIGNYIYVPKTKGVKLRYCPVCQKEQIKEKGYIWFLRAHQLPGVSVCYKHYCSLLRYTGNPKDLLDNELFSDDYCCKKVTAHHVHYAYFLHKLNCLEYPLNFEDLRKMFFQKFIEMGIPDMEPCTDFIRSFSLSNRKKKIIVGFFKSGSLKKSSELVLLLSIYLMFYRIYTFEMYAQPVGFSKFDCENYVIAGKYRKTISLIQHNCGCKFVGTEYGIKKGWGCPDCLSKYTIDEIRLKRLILL